VNAIRLHNGHGSPPFLFIEKIIFIFYDFCQSRKNPVSHALKIKK